MANIPGFDLIEWQQMAKDMTSAENLLDLWERVNKMYLAGQIGKYELDEMRDVIFPALASISNIKKELKS
jgi:UDP-galactopyranose mutase